MMTMMMMMMMMSHKRHRGWEWYGEEVPPPQLTRRVWERHQLIPSSARSKMISSYGCLSGNASEDSLTRLITGNS